MADCEMGSVPKAPRHRGNCGAAAVGERGPLSVFCFDFFIMILLFFFPPVCRRAKFAGRS